MAKAKDKPVQQEPEVDTVLVVAETPPGVTLPRWRVRPKGTEIWHDVEAETVEDAVRAYNGRGNSGRVFPFKALEIERV